MLSFLFFAWRYFVVYVLMLPWLSLNLFDQACKESQLQTNVIESRRPASFNYNASLKCVMPQFTRVCAATFFQTRSTPRGTQFKRFWPRLSWMFSHLTKWKLRLQSIVKSRLLEPSALELVSLTSEHSLSNNVKGNHLSRPRARIIQLRVKQCDNGAKLLLTSVFLRQFKASWSRL